MSELFWKNMKNDVKAYVDKCSICQRNKAAWVSSLGLLQPLPTPYRIWEDINMDFIEGLSKSTNYDTILIVVGRLIKYGYFLPWNTPFTAKEVKSGCVTH